MASNEIDVNQSDLIITTLILIFAMIVGSVGNAIIIFVYKRKNDELTATFFILVLATADLLVCLVAVPFTIAMEWLKFKTSSDFLCKSYFILNTSNTTFSSLLIMAVALDRYMCICHPMHRILTVARAKILVIVLVIFASIIGVLAGLNVQVQESFYFQNETLANGTIMEIDVSSFICEAGNVNHNESQTQDTFLLIVQHTNIGSFIGCILSVIIFYSLIFRVVLQVREKNKTLILKTTPSNNMNHSINNTEMTSFDSSQVSKVTHNHSRDNTNGTPTQGRHTNSPKVPLMYQPPATSDGEEAPEPIKIEPRRHRRSLGTLRKMSLKGLRESDSFQNFRSAAMLFVVAVVYIIVFTPSILINFEVINFNAIIFYLYYLNNASNPLIYSFMNRGFRQDLKRIFLRNRCLQKRFNSYSDGPPTNW